MIILKTRFDGDLTPLMLEKMIGEIKKLPEPTVKPISILGFKPEETALCLQREAIYFDEFNLQNPIKYMGSKYVAECILVYIHSETDHLVVHVDDTSELSFTSYIKRFNYPKSIKVTLAGGFPGKISEGNLRRIVGALYTAEKELQIEITIEAQKILESNQSTLEERYDFVFDILMRKIELIGRQFFNSRIDPFTFKKSPRDLKSTSVKGKIDQSVLLVMASMFSQAVESYDAAKAPTLKFLFGEFKRCVPTVTDFLKFAEFMFSQEAFELLNVGYTANNMYNQSSLYSFVFDIRDASIYRISSHTKTPYEIMRTMVLIDSNQPKRYLFHYDGRTDKYYFPTMSEQFIEKCLHYRKLITDNFADRSQLPRLFGAPISVEYLNVVTKYARMIDENNIKKINLYSSLLFFRIDIDRERYVEGTIQHPQLEQLKQLTGYAFVARQRKYPAYTVDAIYMCGSKQETDSINKELSDRGIISSVERFAEQGFAVCVPAINVHHYSQAIMMLR